MKLLDRIRSLGQELTAATAAISDNLTTIRQQMKAKRDELLNATNASRPPAEVIARFNQWVDETAAHHRRDRAEGLVVHHFGRPATLSPQAVPLHHNSDVTWGQLALFFGPELKQRFAELARSTQYTPGPAESERPAVIERLTRELESIEQQEEALIDEMGAQGIKVEHRPEVVERRANERHRRELAEARREREAAINERHAARRTVGYSSYIYGTNAGGRVRD